jgi:hypothetical protein
MMSLSLVTSAATQGAGFGESERNFFVSPQRISTTLNLIDTRCRRDLQFRGHPVGSKGRECAVLRAGFSLMELILSVEFTAFLI